MCAHSSVRCTATIEAITEVLRNSISCSGAASGTAVQLACRAHVATRRRCPSSTTRSAAPSAAHRSRRCLRVPDRPARPQPQARHLPARRERSSATTAHDPLPLAALPGAATRALRQPSLGLLQRPRPQSRHRQQPGPWLRSAAASEAAASAGRIARRCPRRTRRSPCRRRPPSPMQPSPFRASAAAAAAAAPVGARVTTVGGHGVAPTAWGRGLSRPPRAETTCSTELQLSASRTWSHV